MNVQEMINRVNFWVDRSRSPRFSEQLHILPALNVAMDTFINDRYDNIKQQKVYGFQVLQRVRDELRTIIKTVTIIPTGNVIQIPTDYVHEVSLDVTIDGKVQNCKSVTYEELNAIQRNSFQKPTAEDPVHVEDMNGLNVDFGASGSFTSADLSYTFKPPVIAKGTTLITAGVGVLTIGVTYYVNLGPVTHNSIVYQTGATFVAVNTTLIGPGNVVFIVNCILPDNTHEEICKSAAEVAIGIVEGFSQSQFISKEENKA